MSNSEKLAWKESDVFRFRPITTEWMLTVKIIGPQQEIWWERYGPGSNYQSIKFEEVTAYLNKLEAYLTAKMSREVTR